MRCEDGGVADAVTAAAAPGQKLHGARLLAEPFQCPALGRGECADGQWILAVESEQCGSQCVFVFAHASSSGSMICQLRRLIWLCPS